MIVEAEDVGFDEVKEVSTAAGPAVRIGGLVFHSSLVVDHIEQRKDDSDLIMEVFMIPFKKGLTSSFAVEVPLTQDLKRILFGPARVQIWPTPVNPS